MTEPAKHSALRLVQPLAWPIALWLLHALALRVLFAVDAFGRILGSASAPPLALTAGLVAFYGLRLFCTFVLPGYCVLVGLRALFVLTRSRAPSREHASGAAPPR